MGIKCEDEVKDLLTMDLTEVFNRDKIITEDLITFGGRRPNYNQIVVMGGGSGSGKGFVLANLIGIDGKVFDIDALKTFVLRSDLLKEKLFEKTGKKLNNLDLRNPNDTTILHQTMNEAGMDNLAFETLAKAMVDTEHKPNLIFDVTLASLNRLYNASNGAQEIGYKKEDIHIVWVINDIEVARQQNASRERVIQQVVLDNIHRQVKYNLNDILNGTVNLNDYMDGDFWIVFNQKDVDTKTTNSNLGGSYVSTSNAVKIKNRKQIIQSIDTISKEILDRIDLYYKNI